MAIQPVAKIKYTVQTIMNFAFDEVFKIVRYGKDIYNPTLGVYQAEESAYPAVTKIDKATDPVIYIGKAKNGTATSEALWQIQRFDTTSSVLTIEFADGDKSYDNVWDNRSSLSYS
jgi:hypothetical protein